MADDAPDYETPADACSNNFRHDLLALLHETDASGEGLHAFRDASKQLFVAIHPEIPRSVVCLWCAKRQTFGSYDQHRNKCKGVNLLDPELTAEAFKAKLLAAMPAEKKEGKKSVDALKKVNDSKSLWLNAFYGENGKHMSC
jgi:hypothetical protein